MVFRARVNDRCIFMVLIALSNIVNNLIPLASKPIKMKKFLLITCLAFTSSLQAQTAFKVIGYLPYYRFNYLNDIEFERVTHVNIAFANPDSSGALSVNGVNITNAVSKAHAKNCKVFISLAGGYLTPAQDAVWNYLAQPAQRPAFIQKIIQYVQQYQLDGVDIDLEWQYVQSWYSPFILELKAALAPLQIPLTAALPGEYRYPQISAQALAAFDWVNMMIYDRTGPWAPNNPGQHSPYWWTQDCIEYWQNQGVPADKLTLGMPFYGYDFEPSPVESVTFRYMVSLGAANAYLDQVDEKFYNGIPTIKAKTNLALDEGLGGVMIWELGQDAFGANIGYSLLRAIEEELPVSSHTRTPEARVLEVFPNPVTDVLWVKMAQETDYELAVYSASGQLMLTQNGSGAELERVDMAGLPAGVYWVRVMFDGEMAQARVVK